MITEKNDTCCSGHLDKQKVGNHTYMYRCMKEMVISIEELSAAIFLLVLDNVRYMCTV